MNKLRNDDIDILDILLSSKDIDINKINDQRNTALTVALEEHRDDIVKKTFGERCRS